MRRRVSTSWLALVGVGLALLLGCGRFITLGDLESASCVEAGCGATSEQGGSAAGSLAQAGSSPAPVGGFSGSTTSTAGESSGGDGGGSTGAPGAGGQSAGPVCQPAAMDHSCDGLDEACQPTTLDQACSGTCKGTFVDGSSYMACVAAADFDQAEAACQTNGMHLVKIDSAAENQAVLSLALDDYVWIGGSNRDDANVYVWTDGTPFYSSGAVVAGGYENFATGEPTQDTRRRCVQLGKAGNGSWSGWQCSGNQSFVCERY